MDQGTEVLRYDEAVVDNSVSGRLIDNSDVPESTLEYNLASNIGETIAQNERGIRIKINSDRDELLTTFGKATLTDRYLLPGESYQDLFARVAMHFSENSALAQRIYDYISQHWFMPSTPVLSNGGA